MKNSRWSGYACVVLVISLLIVHIASYRSNLAGRRELACKILPNSMVPLFPARDSGCKLRSYDHVRGFIADGRRFSSSLHLKLDNEETKKPAWVDVLVYRNGKETWIKVPTITITPAIIAGRLLATFGIAGALLATSLLISWGVQAKSAQPILFLYTAISVVVIGELAPRAEDLFLVSATAAKALVPAILTHLALTFPREREIISRSRHFMILVYSVSGVIALMGVVNLFRSAIVWTLIDRLISASICAAWILLLVECGVTIRESTSGLERARARVALWGAVGVSIFFVVVSLSSPRMASGSTGILAIATALLPLPIGYAVSQYRVFDLRVNLRQSLSFVGFAALSAALVSIPANLGALWFDWPLPFTEIAALFGFLFLAFAILDPIRIRLWGFIHDWATPWQSRLDKIYNCHISQVSAGADADECANALSDSIKHGTGSTGVSVFLLADGGWRLASASGHGAELDSSAAECAARVCASTGVVHLADEDIYRTQECDQLRAKGLEVVAAVGSFEKIVGIILCNSNGSRMPYSSPVIEFIQKIVTQSGVLIHQSRLLDQIVYTERLAALVRIGAGLVHDLGKPLGVIEHISRRARKADLADSAVGRDLATIVKLSSEMQAVLRGFLKEVELGVAAHSDDSGENLRTVIEGALVRVERRYGNNRVCLRLGSEPIRIKWVEKMTRILVNLLDNALLASPPDVPVEIVASNIDSRTRIEVIDHGEGMPDCMLHEAFKSFVSYRTSGKNAGLGLTICRDLVSEMGGRIWLESSPGSGTRAVIELP